MPQTLGSLRKALLLVDELARDGGDLGVSELGRRLGLAKNQVFRILKTLEEFDYIPQNDDKTYTLSYRFSEISMGLLSKVDLAQQAASVMDALRDETCETVNLCIRSGLQAVCIAQRASTAHVRMSAQVGRRFCRMPGPAPRPSSPFNNRASSLRRFGATACHGTRQTRLPTPRNSLITFGSSASGAIPRAMRISMITSTRSACRFTTVMEFSPPRSA